MLRFATGCCKVLRATVCKFLRCYLSSVCVRHLSEKSLNQAVFYRSAKNHALYAITSSSPVAPASILPLALYLIRFPRCRSTGLKKSVWGSKISNFDRCIFCTPFVRKQIRIKSFFKTLSTRSLGAVGCIVL